MNSLEAVLCNLTEALSFHFSTVSLQHEIERAKQHATMLVLKVASSLKVACSL